MAALYHLLKSKTCLLLVFFMLAGCSLKANSYYVDTTSDSGLGSLRAAIDSANANPGFDSIVLLLDAQDTIFLQSPLPTILDSLVISGRPCQNPCINGGGLQFNAAVFHSTIANGPLVLNYLNILNCVDTAANAQGCVVRAHQLYVNYCYFAGNEALPNSGFGKGGAVYAVSGWLYNSTFYGNTASNKTNSNGQGGAYFVQTSVSMANCTFDNNYSAGPGGAVYSDSTVVVTNCTFTNNSAGTSGGAISGTDSTSLANSIIWNNTAASSAAGVYFTNPVTSSGCNVLQASGDNFNFTTGSSDISGADPMLDSIGYYSGCVPVVPIFCGSVAQNHASCAGATDTDAQGIPAYGIRDAGAFEITPPYLGGDTIDSIQPGTTADLLTLFNTQGLTFYFTGHYTDSTMVDTGTYTIIGANYLGCSDTATAIIRYGIDTTSDTTADIRIISSAEEGMGIFPNPAEDIVNVRLSQLMNGALSLKIFDATGRAVHTQNIIVTGGSGSFNITNLSDGLYMVQVTDATGKPYCAKLSVLAR